MPNPGNVTGKNRSRGRPFTSETAREARRKRTAKDKANASITEEFKKLVNDFQTDKKGNQMKGAEILAKSLFQGCINGNVKAMELAIALMGEKPAEKIMLSQVDQSVIDEVERMVNDEGKRD